MCEIDWDITIKALTLIVATITAIKVLFEYRVAQKWKRTEFLVNEYSKFYLSPLVQASLHMFDGFQTIFKVDEGDLDFTIDYKNGMLADALEKKEGSYRNEKELIQVRLCIDFFLFRLGLFQTHIESNLINKDALRPYLNYFINLIGNSKSFLDQKTRSALIKYIHDNNFETVIFLFKTYGFQI